MSVWSSAFTKSLKPKLAIKMSNHAENYRVIGEGTSPIAGPWRNSNSPHLIEPMDIIGDKKTETVVLMFSSQTSKSELMLNCVSFFSHQEPSPMLLVQPTIEDVESFSKERIDTMIRDSPELSKIFTTATESVSTSRKSGNTIRLKTFPGGSIAMVGANAPSGLAGRPRRIVLLDEIDRYGITKEGDPIKLAFQRTQNFYNRKRVLASTPNLESDSKIYQWWLKSDQRKRFIPCPHCGAAQTLEWKQVKWPKSDTGEHLTDHAIYECAECKESWNDAQRISVLQDGYFQATNEKPMRGVVGFHVNALYSKFVKLSDLAAEYVDAKKSKDPMAMREFVNLKLGWPFKEDNSDLDWEHLHKRREYYEADVPDGVCLLTAGIDTQNDRFEIEVVGWAHGKQSWGIEYKTIWGDLEKDDPWKELDEFLLRKWTTKEGKPLSIAIACIDSGGSHTYSVYKFCKRRTERRIFAIKGKGGPGVPFVSKPTYGNRLKCPLFTIGVDEGKSNILSRLRIEEEGSGFCHFPRKIEKGYTEEYFKGLLSEKRKFKQVGTQTVAYWDQIFDRNEPFDNRNYATAALEILNPNFVFYEKRLKETDAKATKTKNPTKKRRVLSKGLNQ